MRLSTRARTVLLLSLVAVVLAASLGFAWLMDQVSKPPVAEQLSDAGYIVKEKPRDANGEELPSVTQHWVNADLHVSVVDGKIVTINDGESSCRVESGKHDLESILDAFDSQGSERLSGPARLECITLD